MRNWIGSFLQVILAVVLAASAMTISAPSNARARDSSLPVMAYYYGWWTPANWQNTRELPPEKYDSWRDDVMRRQIDQARSVGITAFICTWQYNCERLLQIAEEMGGFSVAFSVDPLAEHKLDSWNKLVSGMNHMKGLTHSPAYLRWNGKPVFAFWDSWILPGNSGVGDFQNLRNAVDPHRDQFWLGGGTNFNYLDVFDAIHYYDISWESSPGVAMSSYSRNLSSYNSSRGASKPFVATVMPGYDDRLLRGGHYQPRDNGNYYRATWNDVFRYNAKAVVITSWNEWYEGSQIEPSASYGNLYLDITRERAGNFRIQPGNFADPAFERTWAREDRAIAESRATRTWVWGFPRGESTFEQYDGRPRKVNYFDKTRMEINDPGADRSSIWYVTNGLLARELVTGQMQTGESSFEHRAPARVNVAGDMSDPNGPTYATFAQLLNEPPSDTGAQITQRIDRNGKLPDDGNLARYGVSAAYHVPQSNHTVASVFWKFMNSDGQIYEHGGYRNGRLFANPFYATGFPISEAYWAHVRVGGAPKDVLVQCFERRCLTYTPSNPDGWKVEMANVGQHYHRWRYGWSW